MILAILLMQQICIYAENVIDNPTLLYTAPLNQDGPLKQKITLKRKISNINDLTNVLNNISGIDTVVKTQSAAKVTPISLNLNNVTIEELLNASSKKLGFVWSWQNDAINFYALNPVKAKEVLLKNSIWVLNPQDKTLRNALTKWCKTVGWQLVWNVNADYPVVTVWNISGSFESAVNQVLKASQTTNIPLLAIMHDQNHVLEIYSDYNSN